jgi:hypothetical protein
MQSHAHFAVDKQAAAATVPTCPAVLVQSKCTSSINIMMIVIMSTVPIRSSSAFCSQAHGHIVEKGAEGRGKQKGSLMDLQGLPPPI